MTATRTIYDFVVSVQGVWAHHPNGFYYDVFPTWFAARRIPATLSDFADMFLRFRDEAEAEALRRYQAGEDPVILHHSNCL